MFLLIVATGSVMVFGIHNQDKLRYKYITLVL